uniref:Uncharacterized protein n=1 Tax=Romanomermis culicivorax TaxID=13658 RepID=A0A915KPE6_ROMCU
MWPQKSKNYAIQNGEEKIQKSMMIWMRWRRKRNPAMNKILVSVSTKKESYRSKPSRKIMFGLSICQMRKILVNRLSDIDYPQSTLTIQ